MYRNRQSYAQSPSGPPRDDRYDGYRPPPPPPPTSDLPPPPQWDPRSGSSRRDSYQPRDRPDEHRFRGAFSDLRYNDSSTYQRDSRDGRHNAYDRDDRDRHDSRDSRNYRDEYRPPRGEFTFRQEAPPGIDSYRQNGNRYDAQMSRPREPRRTRGGPHQQHRRNGQYQPREQQKAANRILLSKRFDEESELMLGDRSQRASYRNVDELSDSDETDMDISDNGEGDEDSAEPPAKRARTNASSVTPAQDAPKWSNPDPYTALPPPETTGRKKDVVQLIRKARVEAEAQKPSLSTEAAEFISCDISDDEAPVKVPYVQDNTGRDAADYSGAKNDNAASSRGPSGAYNAPTAPHNMSTAVTLPPKPPVSAFTQFSRPTEYPAETQTLNYDEPPPPQTQASLSMNNTKQSSQQSVTVDLTPSTSLGNRKRTIDDEIKPPHATLKKVNRMAPKGQIVSLWMPEPGEDPCPWAVVDHSATASAGARLHKEIVDFYEYVRPREYEEKVRRDLIARLEKLVRRKWRDAKVYPFGSSMSGLYLPIADMDISICSEGYASGKHLPMYDKKKYLFHMKHFLEGQGVAFRNQVEAVTKAKVPLLKYTDNHTGLKIDISFEKMEGHKAIDTFVEWKRQYPAMPPLVALIKHFLLMRGLNEPVNGGIGGFSVICMVVHLLQMMPEVQSGSMKAEEHLGEIFMRFLRYYGKEFHFETVAIRMNPPGIVSKTKASNMVVYRSFERLSIIDPNNPENDISGSSSNFYAVKNSFSKAYELLQDAMMRASREAPTAPHNPKNTLLGPLFAGRARHSRILTSASSGQRCLVNPQAGFYARHLRLPTRPRTFYRLKIQRGFFSFVFARRR